MFCLSNFSSITKTVAQAYLPESDSSSQPVRSNDPKPPLISAKPKTITLPRKKRNRSPPRSTVVQIERIVGAGSFRNGQPADPDVRKSVFDLFLGKKFEGPVEKRLRETGEWLINNTEQDFRSSDSSPLSPPLNCYNIHLIHRNLRAEYHLYRDSEWVETRDRVREISAPNLDMGTLQTWRKAYGALKDTTKVGLAHVNSDYADLEVAIVKATNHVECPPKERHLRKILFATSAIRPRADVAYCIHALARRLAKTRNWTVALKTLIVIHRLLREGDPTFKEEFLNFSQRGRILQLSNFKDDSSPIAWDCSGWVRTYALFLEERLECFRILKYDIEAERLPKPAQGQEKGYSRTRDLESEELLEQLPVLQQLLYRLIGCKPEGAAVSNYVIQYALALVLKESFKIYCAVNDGIINLVDKFFEMPRHEAIKAFDIYRRAGQQAANLSDFYEVCKGLELARNFQFPVLREPPQSFLTTMDEYIREAPRVVTVPTEPLLQLTYRPEEEVPAIEDGKSSVEEEEPSVPADDVASNSNTVPPPPPLPSQNNLDTGDLLGLSDTLPDASSIEERNALALAIVPTENGTTSGFESSATQAKDFDPTGWELALVSTPSSNISSVNERQLAGGMDSLTLNSLYDEAAYRSQQPVYGAPAPNPFEVQDPFAFSSGIPPPPVVQMEAMSQQQMNPFGPFQPFQPQQQQQQLLMSAANPFGDAGYGAFPANPVSHPQNNNNPFGNPGLL